MSEAITIVTLGTALRARRQEGGLTLKQVSEGSGLGVGFLSDIERDCSDPSLRSLAKLASYYEITLSQLFENVVVISSTLVL